MWSQSTRKEAQDAYSGPDWNDNIHLCARLAKTTVAAFDFSSPIEKNQILFLTANNYNYEIYTHTIPHTAPLNTRPSPTLNLVVFRTKRSDSLSSPPDLEVPDLLQFSLEILTVVGVRVVLERADGLLSSLDGVIELIEDGLEGVLELIGPVDGATTGSGRACSVHPIHTILLHNI